MDSHYVYITCLQSPLFQGGSVCAQGKPMQRDGLRMRGKELGELHNQVRGEHES